MISRFSFSAKFLCSSFVPLASISNHLTNRSSIFVASPSSVWAGLVSSSINISVKVICLAPISFSLSRICSFSFGLCSLVTAIRILQFFTSSGDLSFSRSPWRFLYCGGVGPVLYLCPACQISMNS